MIKSDLTISMSIASDLILTQFFILDDLRIYKEILLRDCGVVQFSNGGHLLAIAIKDHNVDNNIIHEIFIIDNMLIYNFVQYF